MCNFVCNESQTTLIFWQYSRSAVSRKLRGSNLTHVRGHGHSSAKAPMSFTVGICVHNTFSYAFTCVLAHLCVCFPLRTNFEGEIVSDFKPNLSQRVWREMCLFCFCKIKFYCKMHMQKCCTEVTILPYWSCCQFFWCGKSWERELKFVEIVWGFTIRSLSNLPATVAGN